MRDVTKSGSHTCVCPWFWTHIVGASEHRSGPSSKAVHTYGYGRRTVKGGPRRAYLRERGALPRGTGLLRRGTPSHAHPATGPLVAVAFDNAMDTRHLQYYRF